MSAKLFLKTSNFQTRRKTVGGTDNLIDDAFLKNIMEKWIVPWAGGDTRFINRTTGKPLNGDFSGRYSYRETLTAEQRIATNGKPYMLTVEGSKLTMYSLDWTLEEQLDFFETLKNPSVQDNGNDRIKRITGGDIDDVDAGLEWEVVSEEGTVTKAVGSTAPDTQTLIRFVPTPDTEEIDFRFYPFLLFNRQHIA